MGSGSSRATRKANRQEKERQATIAAGTGRVNAIFDAPERAEGRGDFLSAVRDHYRTGLDRDKARADRRLKFSMARGGLTGGSAQVDANRTLGEDYTEGLLGAEERAQGALSELELGDEQSRLSLLSMVQQGLDTTTAASRAGAAVMNNTANARSNAFADSLGDVFGNTADIYKRQEEMAARRRGEQAAYASLYGNPRYQGGN
jgi:hypothetical protein